MAEVRLQKLLSERGVASRRKAEELIEQGRVKVNGRVAKLGDKADDRRDVILVAGKRLGRAEAPVYILLHKPRGYITTMSDEKGRKCVEELVRDVGVRVYPIGRLDKDSEGMLLLTNDGDFANLIMHPSHHVAKTYRVTVREKVSEDALVALSVGVQLEDGKTAPAQVSVLEEEPGRTVLQITIYEGRNRQIRRMCEAVNLTVARLKRTAIGPLRLGMLGQGRWRELTAQEVGAIRSAALQAEKPRREKPQPGPAAGRRQ